MVNRTSLECFPTFYRFIRSEHFTPGCDMLLDFVSDPAVCFELALYYIGEEGSRLGVNELIVTVSAKYNLRDRLIIFARLYKLAKALGSDGLAEISIQALWIVGRRMKAEHVMSLANLIFSPKLDFDDCIKEWIISMMGQYHDRLADSWEWEIILENAHDDLLAEWLKMSGHRGEITRAAEAADEDSILSAINQMSTGQTIASYDFVPDEAFASTTDTPRIGIRVPIEELLEPTYDASTQTEPHESAASTIRAAPQAITVTISRGPSALTAGSENAASAGTTIVAVHPEGIIDIEDGWEDIQSGDERPNGADENAKARTVLGISEASGRASTSIDDTRHSFTAETAKARAVMGINEVVEKGMFRPRLAYKPAKRGWRRALN